MRKVVMCRCNAYPQKHVAGVGACFNFEAVDTDAVDYPEAEEYFRDNDRAGDFAVGAPSNR